MAQRSDGPHTPPPPLVIEDDFNHYEVLGVEPTADSAELKRAFAAAAKTHHPDKSEGTPSAFLRVQRAYEVLRDASSTSKQRPQEVHHCASLRPSRSCEPDGAAQQTYHLGQEPF